MSISSDSIQKKIQEYMRSLSGDVSIKLLFPDPYIKDCSNYTSTRDFFADANVNNQDDFEKWLENGADEFIAKNTSYNCWDDFLDDAAKIFVKKKQDLLRKKKWKNEKFNSDDDFENIHYYLNFVAL